MADVPTIGWREWLYLPSLDIGPIKAKVDTGARTSALHAFDIHVDEDARRVRFKVHTIQGRDDFDVEAEADLVDLRMVRDSGGKATLRPIIRVPVRLGDAEWETEISLIERHGMRFRMLLGRESVAGRFIIDCSLSHVAGVPDEVETWTPPVDGVLV